MQMLGSIGQLRVGYETEEAIAAVREALAAGANPNAAHRFTGQTPLHLAAEKGGLAVSELLIANGAQVALCCKHQKTALHVAAERGWDNIAKLFLAHGADVDAVDSANKTPLYLAIEKTPASVSLGPVVGWRPSLEQQGWVDVATTLVTSGAHVHITDVKQQYTPLHLAAKKALTGVAQLLVTAGASVDAEDNDAKSPLDYAWQHEPTSAMTHSLLAVSTKIERILEMHLDAQLIDQLGELISARDPTVEEDSRWLGTEKGDLGYRDDGFWVKGGEVAFVLLSKLVRDAPALASELLDKLLVPDVSETGMMKGVRKAILHSATQTVTYRTKAWPGYNFLSEQYECDQHRFAALDQSDPRAMPVKGHVFALRGVLSDEGLLQEIADASYMRLLDTTVVKSIVQYHWTNFGWTQFMLELIEYSTFVAAVCAFCWVVNAEMDTKLYEVECWGAIPCYQWSSKRLPPFDEQPLSIVLLGLWIILWSALYMVGEYVNFVQIYVGEVGREKRISWWDLGSMKVAAPRKRRVEDAGGGGKAERTAEGGEGGGTMACGEVSLDAFVRAVVILCSSHWTTVSVSVHSLAIAVVLCTWSGNTANLNLLCSVLVLLATLLLFSFLRGFSAISADVNMVFHVFLDLGPFFVIFAIITIAFAFIFHLLLPQTGPFIDLQTSLMTAWNTLLLTHDLETYPTAAAKGFLFVYSLLSSVVLLNMIISILGDTYDRLRETQSAESTKQRLQLMMQMRRSPAGAMSRAWRWSTSTGSRWDYWSSRYRRWDYWRCDGITDAQEELLEQAYAEESQSGVALTRKRLYDRVEHNALRLHRLQVQQVHPPRRSADDAGLAADAAMSPAGSLVPAMPAMPAMPGCEIAVEHAEQQQQTLQQPQHGGGFGDAVGGGCGSSSANSADLPANHLAQDTTLPSVGQTRRWFVQKESAGEGYMLVLQPAGSDAADSSNAQWAGRMQAIRNTLAQAGEDARRQNLLMQVKHEELKKEMSRNIGRLEDENRTLQNQLLQKFDGLEKQNDELKALLTQALGGRSDTASV
jgi:ankyrin repeat protein